VYKLRKSRYILSIVIYWIFIATVIQSMYGSTVLNNAEKFMRLVVQIINIVVWVIAARKIREDLVGKNWFNRNKNWSYPVFSWLLHSIFPNIFLLLVLLMKLSGEPSKLAATTYIFSAVICFALATYRMKWFFKKKE